MLGVADASHAEYDADSPHPWIVPVACAVPDRTPGAPSLTGALHIGVQRDTLAYRILQRDEIQEDFFCSYELDPRFHDAIIMGGLRITGRGDRDEARIVERPEHRFFFASLFLPQHNSTAAAPHPIVTAFIQAADRFHDERTSSENQPTP